MRFVALCSLLLLTSCGSGRVPFAPVLPDPTLRVRIELAAQEYPAGESILATITNESEFPIYLASPCAPDIETTDGDLWTVVQLNLLCTGEVRPPQKLGVGESTVRHIQTRHATGENLPEGTYRALFSVSKLDRPFTTRYSPAFVLR